MTNGKGDKYRRVDNLRYRQNYSRIFESNNGDKKVENSTNAYKVFLNGLCLDTVHYDEALSLEQVINILVDDEGFDPKIKVLKQ